MPASHGKGWKGLVSSLNIPTLPRISASAGVVLMGGSSCNMFSWLSPGLVVLLGWTCVPTVRIIHLLLFYI